MKLIGLGIALGCIFLLGRGISRALSRRGDARDDVLFWGGLLFFYFCLCTVNVWNSRDVSIHDNWYYHYPFFTAILTSLKHWEAIPLWIPYVSNGMPTIVFSGNWYLWLPTRLPFYWLAYASPSLPDSVFLYSANLVLNNVFFALGMFFLLRQIFRDKAAVYWGTCLALMSGVSTGTMAQEQLSASILFIPWFIFFVLKSYQTSDIRPALLAGAALGQAVSNHNPLLAFYFCLIVALCYCLIYGIRSVWRPRLWLACAAVAILFSALPTYNYVRYADELSSPRRNGDIQATYDQIQETRASNSLSPMTLLSYFAPRSIIGSPSREISPHIQEDRAPYYLGLFGLTFAIYAVFFVRSKLKWLSLSVSGVCLLFAMGDYAFVYRLLYAYFPFAHFQRLPIHMGNYINLGLIVLSCLGFQRFLEKAQHWVTLRQGIWLARALICALVLELGSLFIFVTDILFEPHPLSIAIRNLEKPRLDVRKGFEGDPYAERLLQSSILLGFQPVTRELIRADFQRPQALTQLQMLEKDLAHTNTVLPTDMLRSSAQDFDRLNLELVVSTSETLQWNMNFHPAWEANVDKIPLSIRSNKDILMEITIPPGNHTVTFEYKNLFEKILIYGNLVLVFLSGLFSLIYLSPGKSVPLDLSGAPKS